MINSKNTTLHSHSLKIKSLFQASLQVITSNISTARGGATRSPKDQASHEAPLVRVKNGTLFGDDRSLGSMAATPKHPEAFP